MKTVMSISIEEELKKEAERMCAIMGISVSKMVCDALKGFVVAGKAAGLFKKSKANTADLVRLFGQGARLDPMN